MRTLIIALFAGFFLLACEANKSENLTLILEDELELFGTWKPIVFEVDTSLFTEMDTVPFPSLNSTDSETYILNSDYSFNILDTRMYANGGPGYFEINLEENIVEFKPNSKGIAEINGDSLEVELEANTWKWEIQDLKNDTLTILEIDRTGILVSDEAEYSFERVN